MNTYLVKLVDIDEWVVRVQAVNQREARAEALRLAAKLDNPSVYIEQVEQIDASVEV